MKTSQHLRVGDLHSRNQLREQFDIGDATINTGIFCPKGHESVWLFLTAEKASDRTQYVDRLVGDDLYFEGQTQGRTDALIREHEQRGLELLLFHRQRKDEHPDYAFRYEGTFRFVSAEGGTPTRFYLKRVVSESQPASLERIRSIDEIRQNIRRFNRDTHLDTERTQSLIRQTTYWVHDAESGRFGPGKFVGYRRMSFGRYQAAVDGETTGAPFDGGVTRQAIEVAAGPFGQSDELRDKLHTWVVKLFGSEAVAGVDTAKWRFVDLGMTSQHWAFVCNPDKYDGANAILQLDELHWTLDRGDPQPGDRIIIWQAKGEKGKTRCDCAWRSHCSSHFD